MKRGSLVVERRALIRDVLYSNDARLFFVSLTKTKQFIRVLRNIKEASVSFCILEQDKAIHRNLLVNIKESVALHLHGTLYL